MRTVRTFVICLSLLAVVGQRCAAQVEWMTDLHAALDKASAEKKVVMMDFTGTDWCPWCIKLKNEVFDTPQFAAFARENLVCVEVDFPRNKPQTPEQAESNAALAKHYNIPGYPTVVLVDPLASEVGRTGYHPGGPGPFIAELQKIPGIRAVAPVPATAQPAVPPVALPVAVVIPMHYGELKLKGVSGGKNSRLALINNQTFLAGETATVKVNDGRVSVTVKEIREDSVLITVDGTERELKMAYH